MAKLISKTYGDALFELAVEEDKVDSLMGEIAELINILDENPEFAKLMNHPKIDKEEKIKVVEEVFRGRVSDEIAGFFQLIVQKDRYGEIRDILTYFLDEVKKYKGIGVVYVSTATELKDEQKQKLIDKLLATTKFNELEMNYIIDQKLIGGMVIRIGDRVVDSSVSTKLAELEKSLLKIQLA